MIRIDSMIEMVSKKSKNIGGRGTMMMTRIQSRNATTVRSLLRMSVWAKLARFEKMPLNVPFEFLGELFRGLLVGFCAMDCLMCGGG